MAATGLKSADRPRVLVVDDDGPLREMMAVILRRAGLSVTTARDGAAAIERLRHETFLVVLMDLMMPRLNGWDLADWLKHNPAYRPRTVIVVTAADRAVFASLDPSVVNAIIVKPFDPAAMSGYVRGSCQSRLPRDRRAKRIVL